MVGCLLLVLLLGFEKVGEGEKEEEKEEGCVDVFVLWVTLLSLFFSSVSEPGSFPLKGQKSDRSRGRRKKKGRRRERERRTLTYQPAFEQ